MDMSRRAGCYGSVQADLTAWQEHYENRCRNMNERIWGDHYGHEIQDCYQPKTEDLVGQEWVYSKRLAIERMLSGDWRGLFSPTQFHEFNRFPCMHDVGRYR